MRLLRNTAGCFLTLIALSSCATANDNSSEIETPTLITADKPHDAALNLGNHGELHVQIIKGQACHWLVADHANAQPVYTEWPYGTTTNTGGTTIIDASGVIRAQVGSQLSASGSTITDLTDDMTACSDGVAGATWWSVAFD